MVSAMFFSQEGNADAESGQTGKASWTRFIAEAIFKAGSYCFGLSFELMMLEGSAPSVHLKKLRNFQLCRETVYR